MMTCWSGRRDLNPRLQPWQGCTLPLSYSRVLRTDVFYKRSRTLSSQKTACGKFSEDFHVRGKGFVFRSERSRARLMPRVRAADQKRPRQKCSGNVVRRGMRETPKGGSAGGQESRAENIRQGNSGRRFGGERATERGACCSLCRQRVPSGCASRFEPACRRGMSSAAGGSGSRRVCPRRNRARNRGRGQRTFDRGSSTGDSVRGGRRCARGTDALLCAALGTAALPRVRGGGRVYERSAWHVSGTCAAPACHRAFLLPFHS